MAIYQISTQKIIFCATRVLARSITPNPIYITKHGRFYKNNYAALILKNYFNISFKILLSFVD
jgi:hypothetical protein